MISRTPEAHGTGKRAVIANRVTGLLLMLIGALGFLTVADDLRHTGEILGVSAILAAGAVLLLGGLRFPRLPSAAARFLAGGILAGIPLGAALDLMLPGVVAGAAVGTVIALLAGRNNAPRNGNNATTEE